MARWSSAGASCSTSTFSDWPGPRGYPQTRPALWRSPRGRTATRPSHIPGPGQTSRHPILVLDSINGRKYCGYRLASLIEVSVRDLDWRQLTTLIRVALKHIEVHSSAQPGG